MLTVNTQFENELHKLIDEEVDRISMILGGGKAVKSMEEYKYFVGQIEGLRRCKIYCDEVNTLITKR